MKLAVIDQILLDSLTPKRQADVQALCAQYNELDDELSQLRQSRRQSRRQARMARKRLRKDINDVRRELRAKKGAILGIVRKDLNPI